VVHVEAVTDDVVEHPVASFAQPFEELTDCLLILGGEPERP
jgi:hypothetical protein